MKKHLRAFTFALFSLMLGAALHAQTPANDPFLSPTPMNGDSGTLTATNANATREIGEPATVDGTEITQTVWFTWTPNFTGLAELRTTGTTNTAIGLYQGATPSSLTSLGENDEGPLGTTSRLLVDVVAGNNYRILIATPFIATPGTFTLTWAQVPTAGQFVLFTAQDSVEENIGTITVIVERAGGSSGPASVELSTANGTATAGSDYTAMSGTTLNFADGETTKSIAIPITADTAAEQDETFTITLSSPTGGATLGVPTVETVAILNDDTPTAGEFFLDSEEITATESDGILTVAVYRTDTTGAASVRLKATAGTAASAFDFQAVDIRVNFADGEDYKEANIPLVDNATSEQLEHFTISLLDALPVGSAIVNQPSTAIVYIEDDDLPSNDDFADAITITGNSSTRNGTLNGASSEGFIENEIVGDNAIWYRFTATVNPGVLRVSAPDMRLIIFRGTDYNDLVEVGFSTESEAVATIQTGITYYIALASQGFLFDFTLDHTFSSGGSIELVTSSGNEIHADEQNGTAQITLRRSGGTNGVATVTLGFDRGTATGGVDFNNTVQLISFAAGEVEKTVSIPVTNDTLSEGDESAPIGISNPTGCILGPLSSALLIIRDDDDNPTNDHLANAAPLTGSSGNITASNLGAGLELRESPSPLGVESPIRFSSTIWYRWTAPTSGVATFNCTLAAQPGTLAITHDTFPFIPSEPVYYSDATGTARIPVLAGRTYYLCADGDLDGPGAAQGSIALQWSTAPGGQASFGGALASGDVIIRENSGPLTVQLVCENGTPVPRSVTLRTTVGTAIADDFATGEQTITFPAGLNETTVTIPITNDALSETDETFTLEILPLTNVAVTPIVRTVTIADDDNDPTNNLFANPTALPGNTGTLASTSAGADLEPGETHVGPASVWYSWTPSVSSAARVSTTTPADEIHIYTGNALDALTPVTSGSGSVLFDTVAGQTYRIAIVGQPGPFTLNWDANANNAVVRITSATTNANGIVPIAEAAGTTAIQLLRTGNTQTAVSVRLELTEDTADAGLDYLYTAPIRVDFAAGETTKTVNVTIIGDNFVESFEEYLTARLTPFAGTVFTEASGTGFAILDDDRNVPAPGNDQRAAFTSITGANSNINGTTIGSTIEPGEPSTALTKPGSVWYRWIAPSTGVVEFSAYSFGLHQPVVDAFRLTGTTLTPVAEAPNQPFPVTQNTGYFIRVSDDLDTSEGNEFTLNWRLLAGGLIEIRQFFVTGVEGASVDCIVRRTSGTGTATVRLTSAGGTASSGADFAAVDQTLTFTGTENQLTINIPLSTDDLIEGDEIFTATLSAPTNAHLSERHQFYATILDDDDNPANDHFTAPADIANATGSTTGTNLGASRETDEPAAAGSRSVWYRWTAPGTGTATFHTTGSDFDTVLDAFTGSTLATLTSIAANDDATPDTDTSSITFAITAGQTYHLRITGQESNTFIYPAPTELTAGNLQLAWTTYLPGIFTFQSPHNLTASESSGSVNLTVLRTDGSDGTATVPYTTVAGRALSGVDFTATSGTLEFAAGETSKTITVPILNDTTFELNETFTVALGTPTAGILGTPATASVTITSDDAFTSITANYAALFGLGAAHAESGIINVTATNKGKFTGKLTLGSAKLKFKGTFIPNGNATVTLPRKNLPPITIQLALTDGGDSIEGTITDTVFTAAFSGERAAYSKLLPCPQAGPYTVTLAPGATGPVGTGFSLMTITPKGAATLKSGKLADGTGYKASGFVTASGRIVLHTLLYKNGGSFAGNLQLRDIANTSHADATMQWFKPADVRGQKFYIGGFKTTSSLAASRYAKPSKNQRALTSLDPSNGAATAEISGGGLATTSVGITLGTDNKILVAQNSIGFTLKIAATKGTCSASFIGVDGKKIKATGVLHPVTGKMSLLYFGLADSGTITIAP